MTFLNEEPQTDIDYSNSTYKVLLEPGFYSRADYVISPRGISRIVYPVMETGPYRTDNAGLGQ